MLEVVGAGQMECDQRHFEQLVLLMKGCVHLWEVDLEVEEASIDLEALATRKQGVAGVEQMELRTAEVVGEQVVQMMEEVEVGLMV